MRYIVYFFIIACCFSACKDDITKGKEEQELDDLQKYLDDNGYNATADLNTLYIKEIVEGPDTVTPLPGEFIKFHYTISFTDGTVVETTDSTRAYQSENDEDYYADFIFAPYKVRLGNLPVEGLNAGIREMSIGDIRELVIPSKLAYHDYQTLIYEVELVDIIPGADSGIVAYEDSLYIQFFEMKYQEDNTGWEQDTLGIFYKDPGDTSVINTGDTLILNYSQYYLTYDVNAGSSITKVPSSVLTYASAPGGDLYVFNPDFMSYGLVSALNKIEIGQAMEVIIPYQYGYGSNAYRQQFYDYVIIPEYSGLYYKLELKGIIADE